MKHMFSYRVGSFYDSQENGEGRGPGGGVGFNPITALAYLSIGPPSVDGLLPGKIRSNLRLGVQAANPKPGMFICASSYRLGMEHSAVQ